MSLSQEIVADLIGRGMSRRAIGQAIGRNDRLIGYVEKGTKPGDNLAAALTDLRTRLDGGTPVSSPDARRPLTTTPPRRVTGSGKAARVRRKRTITTPGGSSTTLRKQATRSGGRSALHALEAAAKRGQTVAVTVSVNSLGTVNSTSGGRSHGAGGVDMQLGDARDVLRDVDEQYGGDFTAYAMDQLVDAGYVSVHGDPVSAADAVEIRSYSP